MDWTGVVVGVMVAQWVLIIVLVIYLIRNREDEDD